MPNVSVPPKEDVLRALYIWAKNKRSRASALAELGGMNPHKFDRWLKATLEGRWHGINREAVAKQVEAGATLEDLLRGSKPKIRITAAMQRGEEPLPSATARPVDEPLPMRERVRYEDTIRDLRQQLRDAHRADLKAETVRENIFGIAGQSPNPPDWLVEERASPSGPGIPVTIWSDWHWGEVVKAEEVAHRNAFNKAISHERARLLVERLFDMCFNHMVNPGYPGIVVCLGGDMITGTLHDELHASNDMTDAEAVLDLTNVLIWALTAVADRFGRVFVPCVVGNHGRMTKKPRMKGRVHTSFEWLIYCNLERHFANDGRVRFFIPNETDAHFEVNGHRFLLHHGDAMGVKGGDGIIGLLGPVSRGRIKIRDSEAQIGRDFDTLLIGHWHQYLPLPGVVVNGTLKGYCEYARVELRAKFQPASQALFFVNPKRGVVFHNAIYLQDEDRRPANEGWVSWAA